MHELRYLYGLGTAQTTARQPRVSNRIAQDVGLLVREEELLLGDTESSLAEAAASRPHKRRREFLRQQAQKFDQERAKPKSIELRFLCRPAALLPGAGGGVAGVRVERTVLEGPPGAQTARPSGSVESIRCGLVLKSIGYRSVPMVGVPFDAERSVVRNSHGRVQDGAGVTVPGLYTSGWAKRGATGIVGTNIADARDTVDSILQDFGDRGGGGKAPVDWALEFPGAVVPWEGYEALERAEQEAGALATPPKMSEKMTRVEAMLEAAKHHRK